MTNLYYQKLGNQKENTSPLQQIIRLVTAVIVGILLFLLSRSFSTPYEIEVAINVDEIKPQLQELKPNKIAMVIVYHGEKLPSYSKNFLKSIKNKAMDVLFVSTSNASLLKSTDDNIKQMFLPTNFYTFTASRLCEAYGDCTTSDKYNFGHLIQKRLNRPNLVCELRPMFQFIFAAYLTQYDYVGWGDMDIIWGDTSSLIRYLKYDIITVSFGDLNRLYLRGQFSIFRNRASMALEFTEAIPKKILLAYFRIPYMLAEEGLYSKYMLSTNNSILILPFQRSSWDCQDNILMSNNTLECDKADKVDKIPFIEVGPVQEEITITADSLENCSTTWVAKDHRTCIHSVPFGFMIVENNTAYSHPVTPKEQASILRYPLFYHFQKEKDGFEFKPIDQIKT